MMKLWRITLVLVLVVTALAGCGESQATPAPEPVSIGGSETHASAVLDTSYSGALDVGSQLALGAIRLEETENGVTPQQATALLPLWQALQGGTLRGSAEANAVSKQIEGEMAPEQLETIAAMQLTQDDLRAWAQEQGLSLGRSPEELAKRQAEGGSQESSPGAHVPGSGSGGRGGGLGAGGGLSQEEIEKLRATAEASGLSVGSRRAGAGAGQSAILLDQLVELLTQRAAE